MKSSHFARALWYGILGALFFCSLINGFYLWRIMVCGCDLADYDFSRSPSESTFWPKSLIKKEVAYRDEIRYDVR